MSSSSAGGAILLGVHVNAMSFDHAALHCELSGAQLLKLPDFANVSIEVLESTFDFGVRVEAIVS